MTKYFLSLSSLALMSVLTFENNTNLAHRWASERNVVIQKIQANQTVQKANEKPSFNEKAFNVNVQQVNAYSDAYWCASKKDTSKCVSSFSY